MVIKNGKYRHYKNHQIYEVLDIALNTETLEEMVVYKGLYHCEKYGAYPIWARPINMFLEMIDEQTPRFKLIEEKAI